MSQRSDAPTSRQLHLLRALAEHTGTTFTYPRTSAEASAEIRRLKGRPTLSSGERRNEREARVGDQRTVQPSSTVQAEEITGYGSHATWAERS